MKKTLLAKANKSLDALVAALREKLAILVLLMWVRSVCCASAMHCLVFLF